MFMKAGETVFSFGEMGMYFYIILEGEVSVMVPKRAKVEVKETREEVRERKKNHIGLIRRKSVNDGDFAYDLLKT